jgi:hypothetical protein
MAFDGDINACHPPRKPRSVTVHFFGEAATKTAPVISNVAHITIDGELETANGVVHFDDGTSSDITINPNRQLRPGDILVLTLKP